MPYRHGLTAPVPQTFSMSNPSGPCFNFDAVVQAQLNCFLTFSPNLPNQYSSDPLFFAGGVNATVLNTYMLVHSGTGLGSTFSTVQQATTQSVGPTITEAPVEINPLGFNSTLLVPANMASSYNTYCFERVSGAPYANPAILINVYDGNSSVGYLTFSFNSASGIYVPALVSQAAAVAQKAQFGVVGCVDDTLKTSLVLAYLDSNVTTPTAMALISFRQNAIVPFSSASSGGLVTMHGLYAAGAGPDLKKSAFQYNSATMMVLDKSSFQDTSPNSLLLWQLQFLCTGDLQSSAALRYMETYCVGVVSDGSCSNQSQKSCTPFTSNNPVGVSCRKMAALNNASADTAYMNTCGINPLTGKPLATLPFPDVLATADCSCINFSQSTYPQIIGTPPTLDYAGWQAWLKKNNLPAADPSTATCWWPGCTINKANSLILSTMPTKTKPCANIVDCLTVVNSTVQPGGSVSVKALNACGLNGPQGGGGGGGKSQPFYKTQTFNIVLTIVILVLLLGVGVYLYRSGNASAPQMPSTR